MAADSQVSCDEPDQRQPSVSVCCRERRADTATAYARHANVSGTARRDPQPWRTAQYGADAEGDYTRAFLGVPDLAARLREPCSPVTRRPAAAWRGLRGSAPHGR